MSDYHIKPSTLLGASTHGEVLQLKKVPGVTDAAEPNKFNMYVRAGVW